MAHEAERRKQPTLHNLSPGTRVEVRCSFEGTWSPGFEIAEVVPEHGGNVGYRLRRQSDEAVLATVFPAGDIIPLRR
jgi:hypothetical protein